MGTSPCSPCKPPTPLAPDCTGVRQGYTMDVDSHRLQACNIKQQGVLPLSPMPKIVHPYQCHFL